MACWLSRRVKPIRAKNHADVLNRRHEKPRAGFQPWRRSAIARGCGRAGRMIPGMVARVGKAKTLVSVRAS
jgi:hypothetical protein